VSVKTLLFGLGVGPAAWAAQLMLGYGLSSYACFPGDQALRQSPPPGWRGEHTALAGIGVVCLLLALSGAWVAYRSWSISRAQTAGGGLLDAAVGRSRFLAGCGLLASLGFSLAILFGLGASLGVPACWVFPR
jgi:hypothetical protein